MQGGDLIRRGLGMDRVIDRPAVQRAITAPPSAAGQVGRIAGDVAQYAIPVSKVSAPSRGRRSSGGWPPRRPPVLAWRACRPAAIRTR